jgi:hypothetical protein
MGVIRRGLSESFPNSRRLDATRSSGVVLGLRLTVVGTEWPRKSQILRTIMYFVDGNLYRSTAPNGVTDDHNRPTMLWSHRKYYW